MARQPHRVLLLLVKKDLLRRWRSPLGVIALIAFPLVFSGMLALAFSGGDAGPPRARLLVEDRDGRLAGGFIRQFLGAEQVRDFLEAVEVGEEGLEMIENGEAAALLRIPEGTTAKLAAGEAVTLELVRNPAQGILPEIAEQTAAILADVLSILTRLLRQQLGRLGTDVSSFEDLGDVTDEDFARLAVSLRRAFEQVGGFITTPPLKLETATLGEEKDEEEDGGGAPTFNVFLLILPGISIYALFLIGDQMMRDVLTEATAGTLSRQLSAPVTARQVIAGKLVVTCVVAAIVLSILAAIAGFLAPKPVDLAAFVSLSLALVLAVTGFAVLIYSLAKTERQGATISALIYMFLAFTGGSFVPLDNLPRALRAAAPLNPFYWGTQGFQKILDEAAFADVAASVAVLAGIGLVLLFAGATLLNRKVLRGDAK